VIENSDSVSSKSGSKESSDFVRMDKTKAFCVKERMRKSKRKSHKTRSVKRKNKLDVIKCKSTCFALCHKFVQLLVLWL
jgi:hypothetical protein